VHTAQISAGVAMAVAGLGPVVVPSHPLPQGLDNTVMRLREPFHRTLAVYARSARSPQRSLTQNCSATPEQARTVAGAVATGQQCASTRPSVA
jgi:hypothetical protein